MHGDLRFLTAVPRMDAPGQAVGAALDVIRWSDAADVDGILLFTGAGAVLDPWVGAAAITAGSRRLTPMIALNPLYTHPFAAARSLLSIAEVYGRSVDLNLITGAALNELAAIGDHLDHGDRYARLQEYVEIFLQLLDGKPVTRNGRFYQATRLQLSPRLSAELRPRLYLAGASDDARRTARELGATLMGMLPPTIEGVLDGLGAVHLGVLARKDAAEAEEVAGRRFPDDPRGRRWLELSLRNTDSVWRRDLAQAEEASSGKTYRLDPFKSFKADAPYLIGDYETVARHIADLAEAGVHTFVCDTAMAEEEFEHLAAVIERVRLLVAADKRQAL